MTPTVRVNTAMRNTVTPMMHILRANARKVATMTAEVGVASTTAQQPSPSDCPIVWVVVLVVLLVCVAQLCTAAAEWERYR